MNISGEASRDGRGLLFWIRVGGTILSLSLFGWLIARMGLKELVRLFGEIPFSFFLLAIGFICSRYVFQTLRWMTLLRAQAITLEFGAGLRLVLAGLFASNFLPTTVGGDIVRLVGITRIHDRIVIGGASLVADRLIGVASMLPFLSLSATMLADAGLQNTHSTSTLGLLPKRIREGFRRSLRQLREAVELWVSNPGSLAIAYIFSTLAVTAYMVAIWILASGIGIPVSFIEVAGISALVYFITLFPISVNGYGVREIGIVAFYTRLGATVPEASALALVSRIAMICVSLPGVIWLPRILAQRRGIEED